MAEPLRLRQLLEQLVASEIRFVLVGGLAVNAWGYIRATRDIDILQGLPQIPTFASLDAEATDVDMDGLSVRVCSLGHLIGMKRASERPRDHDDLEALEGTQPSVDTGD